jgi:hypothetical protein
MRLVLLYGPPGVGKLSAGTELAALTGFKLFHNHLTVNMLRAVFPFGSEPWRRLLYQFRRDVFAEAARQGIDLVFTAAAKAAPEYAAVVRSWCEPVWSEDGQVLFVQLVCDREELLKRVQNESRRALDKLTDPQRLVDQFDLDVTLPFAPHLRIDSTHMGPAEVAAQIAQHFALPLLQKGEHLAQTSGRAPNLLAEADERVGRVAG